MNLEKTLTEIEMQGLNSQYNFADGHAYHDLSQSQSAIISRLDKIWAETMSKKVSEVEWLYKEAFYTLAESPSLKNYRHFRICPTASNSIDTVATWLAEEKLKVALLEPTFDNLYLILKRRGVDVSPLSEEKLHLEGLKGCENFDAIFLVNPNNPTGRNLSISQFKAVIEYCLKFSKCLLLDNTFRFFMAPEYDQYQILIDSGVTFISIEDTGKVWPTQDMKASLIFFSENIAPQMNIIYEEIYLCVSNFTLGVLTEFLKDAKTRGLNESVWQEVDKRRTFFREALDSTPLSIDPISLHSKLSVEWVKVHGPFKNDLHIMNYFREKNLILLPGRNFFWGHPIKSYEHTQNIRFSFLKPQKQFREAVHAFCEEFNFGGYYEKSV